MVCPRMPTRAVSPPARWTAAGALSDALVAGLCLEGANELAHLRLTTGGFFWMWAAAILALAGAAFLARRGWRRTAVRGAMVLAALFAANAAAGAGLPAPVVLYLAGLIAAWAGLFQMLLPRGGTEEAAGAGGEAARLLLAGAAGLYSVLPFFTDRLVGGVDARWYAYMFTDYLTQWRQGAWPVFLGQGELAYNGAAHPFLTAPFHFYLGALCDLLTARSLAPLAVEHLTVLVCALAGGLGMYRGLTALAPERRWPALFVAIIYVTSPAWLFMLHAADQYMTYMTVATLPPMLYGNARLFLSEGKQGWRWLAAGLALTWMGHAPVAFFCSLLTALLQAGRLLLQSRPAAEWWAAVRGGTWFVVLSAYYFYSISQLPPTADIPMDTSLFRVAGGVLCLAGLLRGVVWRQWFAGLLFAAGLCLLWRSGPSWFWAGALAGGTALVLSQVLEAKQTGQARARGWEIILVSLLVAGFAAPVLWRQGFPDRNDVALQQLEDYAGVQRGFFLPVSAGVDQPSDLQPGWGVWALLAVTAWWALARGSLLHRLLLAAAVTILVSFLRVPLLTEFWVGHMPGGLVAMTNFPLINRLMPVLIGAACLGGFLAPAGEAKPGVAWPRIGGALLVLLAAGALWQTWPFLRRGWTATRSRAETVNQFRPENALLDRYAYDMVVIPAYYSNGKSDPRLESRILNRDQTVRIGPDEIAKKMEAAGREEIELTTAVEPTAPAWLNLSPPLHLEPGEHVLLRFAFRDKAYAGWLIFKSEHLYRDYILPESGWPQAFGTAVHNGRTLSLWNSGRAGEDVRLSFKRSGASEREADFGPFARVTISHFRDERAPVQLQGLIPYRATVEMESPGWLETPRVFLPGYAASVDGEKVPVSQSAQYLVMLPLSAGRHLVELRYVGTFRLWMAWTISAAAWLVLLGAGARRGLGRVREAGGL